MTKTAFDSDFAGKLQDFAAYTDFPKVKPETMTEFDVDKEEDSYVLIMTGMTSVRWRMKREKASLQT